MLRRDIAHIEKGSAIPKKALVEHSDVRNAPRAIARIELIDKRESNKTKQRF
jgi:hypothetical protein